MELKVKKIGVIGAMPSELAEFRKQLSDGKKIVEGMYDFYVSHIYGVEIIDVCCGIGKVNSAICTQILIDKFQVDYIINTGVAGGVADETKVYDMVISKDTVHYDLLSRFLENYPPFHSVFEGDETLIKLAETACKNAEENYYIKLIASGEIFVSDTELKNKIIAEFNPYAVDMETAGIAHCAYRNNIPFVSVRCISDKADEEGEISFDEFSAVAAVKVARIVIDMIKMIS